MKLAFAAKTLPRANAATSPSLPPPKPHVNLPPSVTVWQHLLTSRLTCGSQKAGVTPAPNTAASAVQSSADAVDQRVHCRKSRTMIEPTDRDLIQARIARQQATWQAMLDEPQDPATAARIATSGKRTDKD